MGLFGWNNNCCNSCNSCNNQCCNNDCCDKKSKADVVLYPVPDASVIGLTLLPMVQKTKKYELGGLVQLKTLKCDRELVVKVEKVQNITIQIVINSGGESRTFSFDQAPPKIVFVEKLKKGDTVDFYQNYGGEGEIQLKFKAMIKKHKKDCC